MVKLSEIAWKKSEHVYQDIISHPFNQELMNGTLSKEKFCYYIEQDSFYLKNYANAFAMIAARSQSVEYIKQFLGSSLSIVTEQQTLHPLLQSKFGFKETGNLTPAALSYTSYLRYLSTTEPLEVAVAALLPCGWVYREVGLYIAKNSTPDNPFASWIEKYSSKEFFLGVEKDIDVFDCLSEQTTENIRQQMCDAFYKSTVLEWNFWDDAYKMRLFGNTKYVNTPVLQEKNQEVETLNTEKKALRKVFCKAAEKGILHKIKNNSKVEEFLVQQFILVVIYKELESKFMELSEICKNSTEESEVITKEFETFEEKLKQAEKDKRQKVASDDHDIVEFASCIQQKVKLAQSRAENAKESARIVVYQTNVVDDLQIVQHVTSHSLQI